MTFVSWRHDTSFEWSHSKERKLWECKKDRCHTNRCGVSSRDHVAPIYVISLHCSDAKLTDCCHAHTIWCHSYRTSSVLNAANKMRLLFSDFRQLPRQESEMYKCLRWNWWKLLPGEIMTTFDFTPTHHRTVVCACAARSNRCVMKLGYTTNKTLKFWFEHDRFMWRKWWWTRDDVLPSDWTSVSTQTRHHHFLPSAISSPTDAKRTKNVAFSSESKHS